MYIINFDIIKEIKIIRGADSLKLPYNTLYSNWNPKYNCLSTGRPVRYKPMLT